MSATDKPEALEEELAKLEELGRAATLAISNARNVREAIAAAEIEVPHHLKAIARVRVPSIGRLARVRDLRIEDLVKEQLASIQQERSDLVATREFDRLKAADWGPLRSGYPELFSKSVREGNLMLERKRKSQR
ncbi:MAG: hypothetical protein A3I63_03915 [Betaproteobacteria bacterium RIFCSPLOWO2_02_FULL_66_14]|nr:MAG: hypothetical protein A3I63_03915 [Betaproteobacteria bacterium RIFCSPLOWO2_02_FULL_66_14]